MTLHLVVDITGHGYGHLAQVAPVVAELRRRCPGLRLTARTGVPAQVLNAALGPEVATAAPAPDFGMVMHGPIDVDAEASADAYAALHAGWDGVVRREAGRLAALRPDLLLSDVGYVGLAAAAALGVPAVALSSLNWAGIYERYCAHRPEAAAVHGQMLAAYRSARLFVQVTPHPPMDDLPNRRSVGPVRMPSADRRGALESRLGLPPGERLALFTLGGMAMNGEARALPRLPGLRWLVSDGMAQALARDDVVPFEGLGFGVGDLIRTCDVVVTKPGYGTIVESVCAGTRLVVCERPDWPETPYLHAWAAANGAFLTIDRAQLQSGSWGEALAALLDGPDPAPCTADGAAEAAALILGRDA